jgi:SanA protein
MTKYAKNIFKIFLLLFVLGIIFLLVSNVVIQKSSEGFVFDEVEQLPSQKAGLLLGTGKYLKDGRKNVYFFNRIYATVELYRSGKVQNIIISGDHSQKDYNEPEDMKQELMQYGIPEQKIYLDFAGFRTLDSVVRAKEIFGQNSFIIISQKFHNERAIYLAQKNNIEAVGFNAKDVHQYAGIKTKIREYFAQVKVFVDLFLGVEPKFYGEKIKIQ